MLPQYILDKRNIIRNIQSEQIKFPKGLYMPKRQLRHYTNKLHVLVSLVRKDLDPVITMVCDVDFTIITNS